MGFLRKYANIQMDTNDTNKNTKIIHKELSYVINGIFFLKPIRIFVKIRTS